MVKSGQKATNFAICFGVFVAAVLFRAVGADFGFFNGDERVNDAARFLAGELIPTQHFYPPFFNYLNGLAFAGLFVVGLFSDLWSDTAGFRDVYFTDPTPFYLTARYVTAVIGALCAPLFYSSARRVGLSPVQALMSGGFAAVFPIGVFMAHIAKGDTGLATACLAVVWAFLMRIDTPHVRRWDIVLGVTVALAFGFKQSALLVLGPLALGMIFVLARREGLAASLKSFGLALLVLLVLWPVMNIGILLDIDGFLAFQKIQTVMSVREEDPFGIGLPITLAIFGDAVTGLNPVVFAMSAVVPFWLVGTACRLDLRDALIAIWIMNLLSVLAISLTVGTRQPEHLFLPNLYIQLLLAVVVLMDMLRAYVGIPRVIVATAALAGFAIMVAGATNVLQQALVTPNATRLVAFLDESYPGARVQTGIALPVPQTVAAQQMEFARLDRLGAKYGIDMPEIAEERILTHDAENAIFWVNVPFVMSGLEGEEAKDADFPMQPHTWPIQPEEWTLENWVNEDFDVFVVNDFDYLLTNSRSPDIRRFHAELLSRCDRVRDYTARKPLFLEFDLTVFDCSAL